MTRLDCNNSDLVFEWTRSGELQRINSYQILWKKTTQALSVTNDQKLKIKYKLSNVVVCIEDICMYMTFILVQETNSGVILGNPFTVLIEPCTIDDEGIHTNLKGKNVTFKLVFLKRWTLISSLKERYSKKNGHIIYLKKEVQILNMLKNLDSIENLKKTKSF